MSKLGTRVERLEQRAGTDEDVPGTVFHVTGERIIKMTGEEWLEYCREHPDSETILIRDHSGDDFCIYDPDAEIPEGSLELVGAGGERLGYYVWRRPFQRSEMGNEPETTS